jgi:hypothetical protein
METLRSPARGRIFGCERRETERSLTDTLGLHFALLADGIERCNGFSRDPRPNLNGDAQPDLESVRERLTNRLEPEDPTRERPLAVGAMDSGPRSKSPGPDAALNPPDPVVRVELDS